MALMPTVGPFRINAQRAIAAVSPHVTPAPAALAPKYREPAEATFEGTQPPKAPTKAAPETTDQKPQAAPPQGAVITEGDEYFQRLVKLVPTEVLALYLTFQEIAESWLGVWSVVCLVLVLFVRTVGTHQVGKPIQIVSVLVAAVSFILWVYATGGHFLQIMLPANIPGLTSVSVGVWTFLVPHFYRGD